jgi:hypothetical protein
MLPRGRPFWDFGFTGWGIDKADGEQQMDMTRCHECGKPLGNVLIFCRLCRPAFCSVECLERHRARDPDRHGAPVGAGGPGQTTPPN